MENEQSGLQPNNKPVRIPKGTRKKKNMQCRYDRLLEGTYKKDEIIVFLDQPRAPRPEEIKKIKESFRQFGYEPEKIGVKTCNNCDIPVFLLQAKNIHTVVNTEGVISGSGSATSTVGEEYSLNFYNSSPFDKEKTPALTLEKYIIDKEKERILVAVLDTGFDTSLVNEGYLWKGDYEIKDSTCYKNNAIGWNFIDEKKSFADDNPFRHGSIVSQYIINEFKKSEYNRVEIMPLKTHDENGTGDLFGIICAIHFAMAKGADIINASWGFYYYYDMPIPYLKKLITKDLKDKGILFVTAAGNQVKEEDFIARQIYYSEYQVTLSDDELRNLLFHYFYPARLSVNQRNVITVTTTNESIASWTQNYSNRFADIGVLADVVDEKQNRMFFYVPFNGSKEVISGSSFATAISSGIIGAFCKKQLIRSADKSKIIKMLSATAAPGGTEKVLLFNAELRKKYIINGALTKNWGKP